MPVANDPQAYYHTVSGVRVGSKIVPTVAEVPASHPEPHIRPSLVSHPPTPVAALLSVRCQVHLTIGALRAQVNVTSTLDILVGQL